MNELQNLDAFKATLESYKPSKKSVRLLRKSRLALLVGPSSAGRNTIIKELVSSGSFVQIVSATTRKPRSNNGVEETDGIEYHFLTEEDFLAGLQKGEYIEAAIIHQQQVSGVQTSELEKAKKQDKFCVNEVQVDGAEKYKNLDDGVQLFFVIPPNFDEWIRRLTNRGRMDSEEMKRRLQSAEVELQHALDTDFYTYIINDKYQVAATEILSVMQGHAIDQEDHKERAWQLLNDLKAHLTS